MKNDELWLKNDEGWLKNDEGWLKNDEGWIMKNDDFALLRVLITDRLMGRRTFVIVESWRRLAAENNILQFSFKDLSKICWEIEYFYI